MNTRVKRKMAAQDAVDEDGLIVVRKLKKRPVFIDGKFVMWIRRVIVDRPNKDLSHGPEAASERNEIDEGIESDR